MALLVDAQHDCVLGRAEIKPHDRFELFGEMRIITDLEGLGPMGLESVGPPDSENAGIADPDLVRHAASAPLRGVDRLFEGGQPDHFGDFVGGD